MIADKQAELKRYDDRAKALLSSDPSDIARLGAGARSVPLVYRAPYTRYEETIDRLVRPGHAVLELGAGTGVQTVSLARTGAWVVPTDIAFSALKVAASRLGKGVTPAAADMEALPFASQTFDFVASAGSLSYGEAGTVDAEIRRVLKSDGIFLCVDSLRHNPVYTLKRWVDYKRGRRTRRTLVHMPSEERIAAIALGFDRVSVEYFGTISYLMPAIARLVGERRAAGFSDLIDKWVGTRRSAFKFVLIAAGPR